MADDEHDVEHNVRHLDRDPNDPRNVPQADTGWHLNDEGEMVKVEVEVAPEE